MSRCATRLLKQTFAVSYSRGGLIALLHRLGFDYRKPERMRRGPSDAKQHIDAAHPTHEVRPAGCWARKDVAIAVEQTTAATA